MTVVSLYALLTLVLVLCVEFAKLPPSWALLIGVAIALVQFLLGTMADGLVTELVLQNAVGPVSPTPVHLHRFVQQVCKEKNMDIPRFGIIDDGGPNAFTYGHTPNNARIVITRGLLDLSMNPKCKRLCP